VRLTAEGVETVEQLDFVRECGCTAVQGYYFGKPCPAAEVDRVIERLNAVPRVA
jgi:EAL domain-containing protein (putative c-di-GMP-specific phosphodiesterase class I)